MDFDDPDQVAYRLELEAVYRGWLRCWTWDFTSRYFCVERDFARLVYGALDRRWPGVAKKQRFDPRAGLGDGEEATL
jgi:hypothetical protein